MRTRLLRMLAAGTAVAALGLVPASFAADPGCRASALTRNVWHPVPAPAHRTLRDVAVLGGDGCDLVGIDTGGGVWRSSGRTWDRVGSASGPGALLATGLAPDTMLLALDRDGAAAGGTAGVVLTTDGGRTWRDTNGLDGKRVLDIAVAPTDRQALFAAVAAAPVAAGITASAGPSLYSSADGGRSWSPVLGSSAFAASSVAVDAASPDVVWATGTGAAGGVWVSSNGGAVFREVSPLEAHDVRSVALPGGGSQAYVATAKGVLVSRDQGTTLTATSSTLDVLALAVEPSHYQVLMMSTADGVRRSADAAGTSHAADAGLPDRCRPGGFGADDGSPASFTVRCGDVYVYRGDGTDFGTPDTPPGGLPDLGPVGLTKMTKLRVLHEAKGTKGDGASGSVAFDGDYLYYTNQQNPAALHRVDVRTGRDAGDLLIKGLQGQLTDPQAPSFLAGITYDSLRHQLYAMDQGTNVYDIDLRTRAVRKMFTMQRVVTAMSSFTYDASVDRFFAVVDHASEVFSYDRNGAAGLPCTVNIPQQYYHSANDDEYDVTGPGIAAVVATGDGYLYAELEDDSTVLRLDRSCRVLAAYRHEFFSEAGDENDALACDTVTFHSAAVWLRDANSARFVAYEVPGGYCALATSIRISASSTASARAPASVCAQLRRAGTGEPISDVYVDLLAADRLLRHARTDAAGRTCAAYRPTAADAGASTTAARSGARASQPLLAAFLGSRAYRPSYDRSALTALWPGQLPATLPPAATPPAAPPAALGPPPPVVAPAAPPAPPAPQVQPLPQAHPGAQPGAQAMGQPGAAAQPQEDAEAAAAHVQRDEYRALAAPAAVPDLRVVAPAALLLATAVARRRRQSRVKAQAS